MNQRSEIWNNKIPRTLLHLFTLLFSTGWLLCGRRVTWWDSSTNKMLRICWWTNKLAPSFCGSRVFANLILGFSVQFFKVFWFFTQTPSWAVLASPSSSKMRVGWGLTPFTLSLRRTSSNAPWQTLYSTSTTSSSLSGPKGKSLHLFASS